MNHPANHPFNEPDAELLQRAQRAGIATTYTGFWGDPVRVSADVLTRALDAMGQHADATVVPEAIVARAGQAECIALPDAGGKRHAFEFGAHVLWLADAGAQRHAWCGLRFIAIPREQLAQLRAWIQAPGGTVA